MGFCRTLLKIHSCSRKILWNKTLLSKNLLIHVRKVSLVEHKSLILTTWADRLSMNDHDAVHTWLWPDLLALQGTQLHKACDSLWSFWHNEIPLWRNPWFKDRVFLLGHLLSSSFSSEVIAVSPMGDVLYLTIDHHGWDRLRRKQTSNHTLGCRKRRYPSVQESSYLTV